MGGSAFSNLLPDGSFPRIPPPVYCAIKSRYLQRLQELYHYAAVPREAPEKRSHGDLDILVAAPRSPDNQPEIPHSHIQDAIEAAHVIPMTGNRTSNYAILIQKGEWDAYGCSDAEEEARRVVDEIYYQIDIHVCADEEEWNRIVWFHSFGDLGMILGLIAKNNGLHLGEKGLRFQDPPHPPFHLTADFKSILRFFGLSTEEWDAGFVTMDQLYEWCTSSHMFNPSSFYPKLSKVKQGRTMYYGFLLFVERKFPNAQVKEPANRRDEALEYFGLTDQYRNITKDRETRARFKAIFRGTTVSDWLGLESRWKLVSKVMNEVREVHGGEQGLCDLFGQHGEEALKNAVLDAMRTVLAREKEG